MLDVKLRVKDWLGIGECNHAIQSRGSGGERLTPSNLRFHAVAQGRLRYGEFLPRDTIAR